MSSAKHFPTRVPCFFLTLLLVSLSSAAQTASADPGMVVGNLLQNGAASLHQGKPADAEVLFRQAIVAAPQLPDGYMGLGMAELRQGKPGEAEAALLKATELNPQMAGAHLFLGIAQYQMSEYEAAIASLQQETALQPNKTEALTWLGMAELAIGHPELATGPLDHAAALSPRDPNILDYRARAHTQVAQQSLQTLYDLDPNSWHVHRTLAEIFSAAKQPDQAIVEYKAALNELPNNPDLYEALGNEYQRVGHADEAVKAYEQELKLTPGNPIALFNLGKLRMESDDPAAGIEYMQQAIANHAAAAPSDYYLGFGLAKAMRYKEAAEWLEKSLDNHPSDLIRQDAWYALVRVYQKLGRTADSDHALAEFKALKETAVRKAQQGGNPR